MDDKSEEFGQINYTYSVKRNVGFILIARYMCATCLGPFSGHHQLCQYKNHLKEDTMQ